eukprot:2119707-Rhodomonas_salina.1
MSLCPLLWWCPPVVRCRKGEQRQGEGRVLHASFLPRALHPGAPLLQHQSWCTSALRSVLVHLLRAQLRTQRRLPAKRGRGREGERGRKREEGRWGGGEGGASMGCGGMGRLAPRAAHRLRPSAPPPTLRSAQAEPPTDTHTHTPYTHTHTLSASAGLRGGGARVGRRHAGGVSLKPEGKQPRLAGRRHALQGGATPGRQAQEQGFTARIRLKASGPRGEGSPWRPRGGWPRRARCA